MNWSVVLATLTCVLVANAEASAQRRYRIEPPLGSGDDWAKQWERQQFERERERLDAKTNEANAHRDVLIREKENLLREYQGILTGLAQMDRSSSAQTVGVPGWQRAWQGRREEWERKVQGYREKVRKHNNEVAELNGQWQDYHRRMRAANGR